MYYLSHNQPQHIFSYQSATIQSPCVSPLFTEKKKYIYIYIYIYTCTLQTKYDELRRQDRSKQKDKSDKTERYITACDSVIQPVSKLVLNMHPAKVKSLQ